MFLTLWSRDSIMFPRMRFTWGGLFKMQIPRISWGRTWSWHFDKRKSWLLFAKYAQPLFLGTCASWPPCGWVGPSDWSGQWVVNRVDMCYFWAGLFHCFSKNAKLQIFPVSSFPAYWQKPPHPFIRSSLPHRAHCSSFFESVFCLWYYLLTST